MECQYLLVVVVVALLKVLSEHASEQSREKAVFQVLSFLFTFRPCSNFASYPKNVFIFYVIFYFSVDQFKISAVLIFGNGTKCHKKCSVY